MRWEGQAIEAEQPAALPALARMSNLIRSVTTPEFAGVTFHEVAAKSALNRVHGGSALPFGWTINPYRGCSHACVYCFARSSHEYLELDSGRDFDSQVIVKVNVAEVLRAELAKPSWGRDHVALGTNTDPYQRAEGRYRLMPGIIRALADSGTPFSILTKGTMLRRDLPVLAEAARSVPVQLAMSIAIFDDDLQRTLEPGTPSASARLATVTAARDAGFDVSVFLMPVLPFLTDSTDQLDDALSRIKDAGASAAAFSCLHLRPGTKEWFARWLNTHRPDLTPRYRELYGDDSYAPVEFRRHLSGRVRRLMRAHGMEPAVEDPATGSAGVSQSLRDANGEWRTRSGSRGAGGDPQAGESAGLSEPLAVATLF